MSTAAASFAGRFGACAAALIWPAAAACASAGRLGGAAAPDISWARILAAMIVCLMVAVLALLLVRQKGGKLDLRALAGRVEFRPRCVDVVETRRLSTHGDISVIRYDGREYLLLLQAGNAKLLAERSLSLPPLAEAETS
jgi:hypothetical protein